MASVTQRIRQIKQPRGGYLKPSEFTKIEFDDGKILGEENLHSNLVGMAVDYLSRFMLGTPVDEAFKISILGAKNVGEERKAHELLRNIKGLDDKSIRVACKIVGYDVCYRVGPFGFNGIDHIEANTSTVENIRIMVARSLTFFEKYGPITKDGFTFEGGYTNVITAGDGDFLTADTLWDFKVSKNGLTSAQTLQLLIYYIMGKQSIYKDFDSVKRLGIFNPRQNSEDNLPLTKTKNRYMISRNDLQVWLEAKAEQERRQRKAQFIGIMIIIIIAIAFILFYFPSIQDLLFPLRNLQTK